MPRLTKSVVDKAAADPERRIWLWDSALPGFGLLVLPSGVKSFVYQYRTAEGRSRRATIGKVGTLTPEAARKTAEAWATEVRAGADPLETKEAKRAALTLNGVLDAYLASAGFQEKADSTRLLDQGRIRRHLRPLLGRIYADKLTPEQVRRAFATIRDGKTKVDAKERPRGGWRTVGGEAAARDAIKLLRAVLNWAKHEGMVTSNPATLVKTGSHAQREAFLEDSDQYGRLFATLAKMEEEQRIRRPVADAIRVIALTGARRGEIGGCRWRHVDLKAGTITLPPAAHKTGRRTGKARVITLPTAAQEIIARQPEGGPDDFVFQPSKGAGVINLSAPWRRIRAEAELPEGIGLHGLRHSLASHLALGGAQAAEIMAAMGHRQMSTAQRYVHFADKARATLAERAAAPALAGMASARGDQPAEVVPLPTKARR
ncbi:MAG: DUF4102 domain-containing protein [Geminicoccaceae bacterium]|nr:MAG: DUF4102 domain-containing protein [Geminicoccaceae bacterium]